MYWAVISHLIHEVYHSDAKTREVMLDRAINGLKRCKERVGAEKYNDIMDILHPVTRNSIGLSSKWFEQPIRWISSISSAGPDGYGAPKRAEGKGLFYRYH